MRTAFTAAFTGIPTFFRACCRTAAQGGSLGYEHPGRELARNISRLCPHAMEASEWESEVEQLEELLTAGDDNGALDWFITRYPKCMALVPTRRRNAFLIGVRSMLVE